MIESDESGRSVEASKAIGQRERKRGTAGRKFSLRLVEQGDDLRHRIGMAPEGSRWAGDVRDDIDRNGVLGVPIHDVQELQRFDSSGKAADCALFLRAECL